MYAFTQHRPATVRQAASLLTKQEEAKLLAGGHTLIPTMKLRLAGPKHIIDMSRKMENRSVMAMSCCRRGPGRSIVVRWLISPAAVATPYVR